MRGPRGMLMWCVWRERMENLLHLTKGHADSRLLQVSSQPCLANLTQASFTPSPLRLSYTTMFRRNAKERSY